MSPHKPRLLDLFSGAGGAAFGYMQAGFDVTGIDIAPQPNYIGDRFIQADALLPPVRLEDFDLIHASPPCQAYSTQGRSSRWGTPPSSPPLIADTQAMLDESGVPFVIENVAGAREHLREPMIALRGHQFGLYRIDRLRYFELGGWFILQEPRTRRPAGLTLGVYGRAPDGRKLSVGRSKEQLRAPRTVEEAQEAMGMPWCDDWRGIAEAIPPAYTKFIGEQFLDQHVREGV